MFIHRRAMLATLLAAPALPITAHNGAFGQADSSRLSLTPACAGSHEPTPPSSEGPFFKARAPLRHDLSADMPETERVTIAGFVLDVSCRPVPGALMEVWQADDRGVYDNVGFRLRGHQRSDEAGRWQLTTVVPGLYPGRTRHIHVKVQRPGGRVLTTELFFPSEQRNARDGQFDKRLLLAMERDSDGMLGRFDFVV